MDISKSLVTLDKSELSGCTYLHAR